MKIPNDTLTCRKTIIQAILYCIIGLMSINSASAQPVSFRVDLNQSLEKMKPVWAWVGYDEPNYTYMKDGKKLLSELSDLSYVPVNVRVHNLLTSGDGTPALKWGSTNAYTEDKEGNPIYDWSIVDRIFDTFITRGMKPLVEIGFMPEALSSNPYPYQHKWDPSVPYNEIYTGWTYPPKEYNKWRELVYQWAKHCIERYGEKEVTSWYWEVWNEPNIGYWHGTFEEYCKLYDYAADGLKRALPNARIGGPHSTDPGNKDANTFLRNFLEHCVRGTNYATGKVGSPIDYIGFHAKGNPTVINGAVRMDLGRQMRNVSAGFEVVASFPELKHLPIIIGECDPEGCAACSVEYSPQNAYRNGTMYSSYTAASFACIYELARKHGVNLEGAVSWAFEFEEQPWFAGFRDLATNGVDKPVLNVFRMYGMMEGDLVPAESSSVFTSDYICKNSIRKDPDVGALASKNKKGAAIMVWNYHDDNLSAPPSDINLKIQGIKKKRVTLTHYRIDDTHSNAYTVWKEMGSPQNPSSEQIAVLEKSGQLQMYTSPSWTRVKEGEITLHFSLPRQGVSLIKLTW